MRFVNSLLLNDMIIDFHTHTYPDNIAHMIIERLSGPSGVRAYTDATISGLTDSCKTNGISKCVVLPVVTNPNRTAATNKAAAKINEQEDHLISFGGIHPDCSNYKEILASLAREGFLGIKLHPVFQETNFDDIRYMRIVDCACENGLIISVHAGLDINDDTARYAAVPRIRNLLSTVRPDKMVLAHMGGHLSWDEAEDMLSEYLSSSNPGSLYLDTAFCLPVPDNSFKKDIKFLDNEQFIRIVRLVGSDHVLFGTDSPWTDHAASIASIKTSGLTEKEISQILYQNARYLLGF